MPSLFSPLFKPADFSGFPTAARSIEPVIWRIYENAPHKRIMPKQIPDEELAPRSLPADAHDCVSAGMRIDRFTQRRGCQRSGAGELQRGRPGERVRADLSRQSTQRPLRRSDRENVWLQMSEFPFRSFPRRQSRQE
jgi:hypothetical protein